ncbi:hypothetical protein N9995_00020 [bacterium]|nr:hypothetical protein [bacterium]
MEAQVGKIVSAQVGKIVSGHIDRLRADINCLPGPTPTNKSEGKLRAQRREADKTGKEGDEEGGVDEDGEGGSNGQQMAALASERVGDMIKRQGELEKKSELLLEMMCSLDGSVQGVLSAWHQDEQDKRMRNVLHQSVATPVAHTLQPLHINSDVTTSSDDSVEHHPSLHRRHHHHRSSGKVPRGAKAASNSSRGVEASTPRPQVARASEAGSEGVHLPDVGAIANSFAASKARPSKGKESRAAAQAASNGASEVSASWRQVRRSSTSTYADP